MLNRQWRRRDVFVGAGLLVTYIVAGKLGLTLALLHPSATAVWPPTGVTLAAFLVLGFRFWPVILLGAFVVNLTTLGNALTSLSIALGNTTEGLVGAYLVQRFADGRHSFARVRSVFFYVGLAAILSTVISATVGVTTLTLANMASTAQYGPIWLTWWLGDAVGALIVAPVLILWWNDYRVSWDALKAAEAGLLLLALVMVGQFVFGPSGARYPLTFVAIPLFAWAAFRFGPREAATAVLVFAALAIKGTLEGRGPFSGVEGNESLLLLQSFSGVTSVTILGLAAAVAEGQRAEALLRELTIRDPLTGLSNYRHFVTSLEAEIARAERTERPFAIVLLDLDDLKKINDLHGHMLGSRVLIRLATVLRESSRAMDTTARIGGDEFVVILPEVGEEVARQVARRVNEEIRANREPPSFSASIGIAVYPRDGKTPEALVAAADRGLYAIKARRSGLHPAP